MATASSRNLARAAIALAATGCFVSEPVRLPDGALPYAPDVGAPEGWLVASFETPLECPDGATARFWLVYPEAAASDPARPALPVALVFHSGAFDYVPGADPTDPLGNPTWRQANVLDKRLTLDWAARRVMTTLGLHPNTDEVELHAGTLPAALAEKGFALLLPGNCWGDLWHNRVGVAENAFSADFFFRNGRTVGEFAWLHATEGFPPGNPVELPVAFDPERVVLVGLGDGGRAVSELLSVSAVGGDFAYRPWGVLLDSPNDDLRAWFTGDDPRFANARTAIGRIFPETGEEGTSLVRLAAGAFTGLPRGNFPSRFGLMVSSNDTAIPAGANDVMRERLAELQPAELWVYDGIEPAHVLTNADVELAAITADFLGEGLDAVPESLRAAP